MFTGRFGLAKGPVLFDRICPDNGIRHLLTAPYSPTTTGKIERLHKTMRTELFNTATFGTLEEAQGALDTWVQHYNHERPHQGMGVKPIDGFQTREAEPVFEVIDTEPDVETEPSPPPITRRVGSNGAISLAGFAYRAGRWLAGEVVEVISRDGLIECHARGALIVTHARRHSPGKEPDVARTPPRASPTARDRRQPRAPRSRLCRLRVLRRNELLGRPCLCPTTSRSRLYRRALRAGSGTGRFIRIHPIRHDRAKEHGAFATPKGHPRKQRTVA